MNRCPSPHHLSFFHPRTSVIANHWPLAFVAIAKAKGAEADTADCSDWNALDYGRRERGQEKQREGGGEENG